VKDVHKHPVLDLLGWYAVVPKQGPQQYMHTLQIKLSTAFPECSLLLGFHPEAVAEFSDDGQLPITIWETRFERIASGEDQVVASDAKAKIKATYTEVPYTIETGEAEMISVDYVAKGTANANATATETSNKKSDSEGKLLSQGSSEDVKIQHGNLARKQQLEQLPRNSNGAETSASRGSLSREDEELIASLATRANAIKMLQSRLTLFRRYIDHLPVSYTGTAAESEDASSPARVLQSRYGTKASPIDDCAIRSIYALLSRLALLVPDNSTAFNQAMLAEQNEVELTELLASLGQSITSAHTVGNKHAIIENARATARRTAGFDDELSSTSGRGLFAPLRRVLN
jgi:COP9 signalosome complex subunit 6